MIGSATAATASTTVAVGSSGTIVAKGAAAIVPVTVTCDPNPFPFPPFPGGPGVSVSISQRAGNRIAQGFGGTTVLCDGTPHTYEVQLTANGAPFKHGTALATATMTVCDFSGCHTATDTEEITLTK